jgi:hypothetical protein
MSSGHVSIPSRYFEAELVVSDAGLVLRPGVYLATGSSRIVGAARSTIALFAA